MRQETNQSVMGPKGEGHPCAIEAMIRFVDGYDDGKSEDNKHSQMRSVLCYVKFGSITDKMQNASIRSILQPEDHSHRVALGCSFGYG